MRKDNKNGITWLPEKYLVLFSFCLNFISRSSLAFKEVGIQKIGQVSPAYISWCDFVSVPREFFAYPAYFLGIR